MVQNEADARAARSKREAAKAAALELGAREQAEGQLAGGAQTRPTVAALLSAELSIELSIELTAVVVATVP